MNGVPRIWVDGVEVSPLSNSIPATDRGLLFGDAVFETLRSVNGQLGLPTSHFERLDRSLQALGLPPFLHQAELRTNVLLAYPQGHASVRITVTAGDGLSLQQPLARPRRIVMIQPLVVAEAPPLIRAACVLQTRVMPKVKTTNYVVDLATRRGQNAEAIYCTGDIALEGGTGNLLMVRDNRLISPEVNVLDGIVRDALFILAPTLGLKVERRDIRRDELHEADEVLLTSSVREVAIVSHLDDTPLRGSTRHPWAKRLQASYRINAYRSEALSDLSDRIGQPHRSSS